MVFMRPASFPAKTIRRLHQSVHGGPNTEQALSEIHFCIEYPEFPELPREFRVNSMQKVRPSLIADKVQYVHTVFLKSFREL
jgi:hypothetical protein